MTLGRLPVQRLLGASGEGPAVLILSPVPLHLPTLPPSLALRNLWDYSD